MFLSQGYLMIILYRIERFFLRYQVRKDNIILKFVRYKCNHFKTNQIRRLLTISNKIG